MQISSDLHILINGLIKIWSKLNDKLWVEENVSISEN